VHKISKFSIARSSHGFCARTQPVIIAIMTQPLLSTWTKSACNACYSKAEHMVPACSWLWHSVGEIVLRY